MIPAGAAQVTTGVAWVTVSVTLPVAVVYLLVSVGVKVTESVCGPAVSTVPAAGEYVNVPGAFAVASN